MLELAADAAFIIGIWIGIWLIVAIPAGVLIGTIIHEMGGEDDM